MKKIILLNFLFINSMFFLSAQTIWTYPSNGNASFSGNVGIGIVINPPTSKLEIGAIDDSSSETMLKLNGTKYYADSYNLSFDKKISILNNNPMFDWQINQKQYGGYNGNVMTFYRNGFVGIATTTPTAKLEIGAIDDSSNESMLKLNGTKYYSESYNLSFDKKISILNGNPMFDWQINQKQYGGYNGNIMTFNRNGFVGIATTAPTAKFEIGAKDDASSETMLKLIGAKGDADNYNLSFDKKITVLAGNPMCDWQINQKQFSGYNGNVMTFYRNGFVGIKCSNPKSELDVNGTISANCLTVDGKITAEEIEVKDIAADFVFEKEYQLNTLEEVEVYINTHKHLPSIAPASETSKGVNLGKFNTQLLQKVEELTLYMIEQNKRIEKLEKEIAN